MDLTRPDTGKFGFIGTQPGISKGNMVILMYAAFVSIALATFDAFGTPYVLSASIGVPIDEQGAVVGRLNVYTELVLLAIFTPIGVLSDRIGRRVIYAAGFFSLGLSYALFPFATSVNELAAIRVIYSLGLAGVTGMLATVVADYVVPEHRGRMIGLTGMFNGLGIVMSALLLAKLPSVLVGFGYDDYTAGKLTLFTVAGLCAISAAIVYNGLKPGPPPDVTERVDARELFSSAIRAARENPRIAVAYASAFVARGDLVVVGTFLVLWGKVAAMDSGMDTAAAIDAGRIPFVIAQSAGLLGAIAAIMLIDRVHRLTALACCMGLAAIAYCMLLFVDDPLDSANIPFFLLLGLGQVAALLGSSTLINKEAPAEKRGAIIGAFSVVGAMGILMISGVGGSLFDTINPRAPFVMLGIMNIFVMAAAIYVRLTSPGKAFLSTSLT